jgi:Ca-activated chloride channel homolog
MRKNEIQEKFLDLVDGSLAPMEEELLRSEIENDPVLKRSFERYLRIVALEKQAATVQPDIPVRLKARVLYEVEAQEGFFVKFWSWLMEGSRDWRSGATAALAITVCLSVYLAQQAPNIGDYAETAQAPSTARIKQGQNIPAPLQPLRVENPAAEESVHGFRMDTESLRLQHGNAQQEVGGVEKDQSEYEGRTAEIFKEMTAKIEKRDLLGAKGEMAHRPITVDDLMGSSNEITQDNRRGGSVRVKNSDGSMSEYDVSTQGELVLREGDNEMGADAPPLALSRSVNSDEGYSKTPPRRFTDVHKEAISTFSIDVDTASYTNARRYLQQGMLPPPESIRPEEFINYFDYNYPSQSKEPFAVHYEIAPSPLREGAMLLKLGIKAKESGASDKPWNLVFLVDVSGSMDSPEKLPLVKRAILLLARKMTEKDRISIVTYADGTQVALSSASGKDQNRILSVIESLAAGGSTNGSGGIQLAYDEARKNFLPDGVNRVILATDGDFNVGLTNEEELTHFIEEKRSTGVSLTTLGFGTGNLKDNTMELLADKGNGNYFYVDSFQEAQKIFETQLTGTIEVVAKDVKLQVEFNPSHVVEYRLLGYENRDLKKEEFNDDRVDAGEIGVGHTVTALYELVFANSPVLRERTISYRYGANREKNLSRNVTPWSGEESKVHLEEVGFLKIRFKTGDGQRSTLLEFPIQAKDAREQFERSSGDFQFATAVGYFAEGLRGENRFLTRDALRTILQIGERNIGTDSDGYRREFVQLVKTAESILLTGPQR